MVGVAGAAERDRVEFVDRTQHLSAVAEDDTEVFEVLIGQVAKDREINAVVREALSVLGHPEHFEPVRNLLHRRPASGGLIVA